LTNHPLQSTGAGDFLTSGSRKNISKKGKNVLDKKGEMMYYMQVGKS